MKADRYPLFLGLAFLGLVLFFAAGTGRVHLFDWDEINFAESAREMLVTRDFLHVQVDFSNFHEKPPFFFWMQALAMEVLGVGEVAARFPNAVCGAISILLAFLFGRRLKSTELGWAWATVLAGTFLPHLYFKTGIIDPWFNLLIFASILGLFQLTQGLNDGKAAIGRAVAAGVCAGLAVLTKGPVALGLIGLTGVAYFGVEGMHRLPSRQFRTLLVSALIFSVFALGIGFSWYIWIAREQGGGLFGQFVSYQLRLLQTGDAGHGQPWYYHPLVLLFGCFPATAFLFESRPSSSQGTPSASFDRLMVILAAVVVVVFSLVKTKIVHYSSMAWLPITFLAAHRILGVLEVGGVFRRARSLIFVLALPLGLASIGLPLFGWMGSHFESWIHDPFVLACFRGANPWRGWEFLPGVLWLGGVYWIGWRALRSGWCRVKVISLFVGTAIFASSVFWILLPRLEQYTQGPYIQFLQERRGQRIDVEGFKSFAHLFYADRVPETKNQPTRFVVSRVTHPLTPREGDSILPLGGFQAVGR